MVRPLPTSDTQIVAYLPASSVAHVRRVLRREGRVLFARNRAECISLLSKTRHIGALIDPSLDAELEIIHDLLRRLPPERIILYVQRTPENLRTVLTLSREGISNVFVHPLSATNKSFHDTIDNLEAVDLTFTLATAIQAGLTLLPFHVARAVADVFRRPYRYHSARDIAIEAAVSSRSLYRAFRRAQLGSPRNILAIAKVAYGFAHLQAKRLGDVSRTLGYSRPCKFAEAFARYTGAKPASAPSAINRSEVVTSLVENLFKPAQLCRQRRTRDAAARSS